MGELLSDLDSMIEQIIDHTLREDSPQSSITKLLRAAKGLIDAAEQISDRTSCQMQIASPFTRPSVPDEFMLINKQRFQEEHVNPTIQQEYAKTLYKIRRVRDRVFQESEMFAEPAWDMLLDLVIAERDNKSVSVTSACLASCVPLTTGLRWVSVLESKGYIERTQDHLDARRKYLMLTEKSRVFMNRFFADLVRLQLI